jgi:hypothetical protein
MSNEAATELAPARSRTPSRTARKRDERVRRVVQKIRKHATWLHQPHFATLLYTYCALWVRFVDLNSVKAEPVDDLGQPNAITGIRRGQLGRNLVFRRPPSARCGTMPRSRLAIRSGLPSRMLRRNS